MKSRKIYILNYILAILLTLFCLGYTFAWYSNKENVSVFLTGSAKSYFGAGDGTESSPYLISNKQHMYNFAYLQARGDFDGENSNGTDDKLYYFKVEKSFSMEGVILPPIGNAEHPFNGVFDGNKCTISNVVVTTNKKLLSGMIPIQASTYQFSNAVGLFGTTAESSEIKNLILNNPVVEVAENNGSSVVTQYQGQSQVVGLAIGYIANKASSIGIIGGKLLVRRTYYSTINSIIGGVAEEISVDITGGGADVGIFNPQSGSTLATIINGNAELATKKGQNNNGLWIVPAAANSTLGQFSITIKPTVNASATLISKASVTIYDEKTKKINVTGMTTKDLSNIVENYDDAAEGKRIETLTGYLAFSGMRQCYSYDTIVDEYGNAVSGNSAGAYNVIGNTIKFNINHSNSTIYIIAASNSGTARTLKIYRTVNSLDEDSDDSEVDYSDPASFYNLYQCASGHSQYNYSFLNNSTQKNTETLLYYNGTSYDSGLYGTKDICNYHVDCDGTIYYDAATGKYYCSNYGLCEQVYEAENLTHTDECYVHSGGVKTDWYRYYGNTSTRIYFNGAQVKIKDMLTEDSQLVESENAWDESNSAYGGSIAVSTNVYTNDLNDGSSATPAQTGFTYTDGENTFYPFKVEGSTKSNIQFTPDQNGKLTFTMRAQREETNVNATFKGISINGKRLNAVKDWTATQDDPQMYEATFEVEVEAGTTYQMTVGGSGQQSSLCYVDYEIGEAYTGCTLSSEEHYDYDFVVDQSCHVKHQRDCGEKISLSGDAATNIEEIDESFDASDTYSMTLNGTTPCYKAFTGLKEGSYQIASTSGGIRIYYLRVDGMEGGNGQMSNVRNIDFVYDGVTIDTETTGTGSSTTTEEYFAVDGTEYKATKTRISLVKNSPAVTLFFYRKEDGSNFIVGISSSSYKLNGYPSQTVVIVDITLTDDYVDNTWVPQ